MRAYVWATLGLFALQLVGGLLWLRPGAPRNPVGAGLAAWWHVSRTVMVCWAIAALYFSEIDRQAAVARATSRSCSAGGPIELIVHVEGGEEPRAKGARMDPVARDDVDRLARRHGASHFHGGTSC